MTCLAFFLFEVSLCAALNQSTEALDHIYIYIYACVCTFCVLKFLKAKNLRMRPGKNYVVALPRSRARTIICLPFILCIFVKIWCMHQVRQKTAAEVAEEEELLKKEAEKMADQGDGGEEEDFLKDFVANRRWLDPHAKKTPR